MASTPTQKHRVTAVGTSLGEDVLLLHRMSASEQLGQPFEIRLDLLSLDQQIDALDLLGHNMTVRLEYPEGGTRYFNGYVSSFAELGEVTEGDYMRYRAVLRPWLWFLTRTADCRIFQKPMQGQLAGLRGMKVPDILAKVFDDHGFAGFYEEEYQGSYQEREYCVQYRETAFNFVSRLMQSVGIYYYFSHENGKHTMHLVDAPSAHTPVAGYAELPYRPDVSRAIASDESVQRWSRVRHVQPGAFAHNAFDFKHWRGDLLAKTVQPKGHALADFEIYDFPGAGYHGDSNNAEIPHSVLEDLSKIRHEELMAQHSVFSGESNAHGLSVGSTFALVEHPNFSGNYLLTSATYEVQSDFFFATARAPTEEFYSCSCTAIEADQQFRSPRTTPEPFVQGPQTAIVTGGAGDEICTDEFGRVKVKFPWDRYQPADDTSSCWIRVAQYWAGKKWGAMFLPRVGQEVIVDFLEGKPDRPIITGRVYNDDAKPPYDLPDNKTVSTLKSNSSKGGQGFNEIRFEDKKGEEQLFIHAEKNEDIRVKDIAREWIGNERHLITKKKQFEMIEGEKHLIVKSGDGGAGDQMEKIAGDKHLTIGGDHNQKSDGSLSIKAGGDIQLKTDGNYALAAPMGDIHIKAGMNMVLEAGMKLTLKVGGNFVVIDMSGVAINGMMVKINSGGSAGSGAGSSPETPTEPEEALEADNAEPGQVSSYNYSPKTIAPASPDSVTVPSYQALALQDAAASGAPFCEQCAAAAAAAAAAGQ